MLPPLPRDARVGAHRSPPHLSVVWRGGVAAQHEPAHAEALGGAEDGADVEGGAQVAASVLSSDVWDEVHVLTAPTELGSGLKAPIWPSGHPAETRALSTDMLHVWNAGQKSSPC